MIFSRIRSRRWRHALVGVLAVVALAACGGGTSQYDPFVPQRLLVFGDETSAITESGLKYSINGFTSVDNGNGTTTSVADCRALPNWVQSLASNYGFVFAECNPNHVDTTAAHMLASPGAKVEDIGVQIDGQISVGGFRDKDLATVLAGQNDIIELYQQFPGRSEEDLANDLHARGKQLALQINRLVDFGVKVIVSTVPDLGVTPYAAKQRNEFTDTDRAALLTRLTAAFNEQLGVNITLDGRFIGLAQTDIRIQAMARSLGSFGTTNVTTAACLDTTLLPDCDSTTLVAGAVDTSWMWSDDLHLAFVGQQQIASLAIDRARHNPF